MTSAAIRTAQLSHKHMGHTEDVKLQPLPWGFLFMMEFLSDSKNADQGEITAL